MLHVQYSLQASTSKSTSSRSQESCSLRYGARIMDTLQHPGLEQTGRVGMLYIFMADNLTTCRRQAQKRRMAAWIWITLEPLAFPLFHMEHVNPARCSVNSFSRRPLRRAALARHREVLASLSTLAVSLATAVLIHCSSDQSPPNTSSSAMLGQHSAHLSVSHRATSM
jgi:hypothetical protein